MKKEINDARLSHQTILVERNVWVGGFCILVDQKPLKKKNRTTFELENVEGRMVDAVITGNDFKGLYLVVEEVSIELFRPLKVYEILMAFLPLWTFGLIMQKPGAIPGALIGLVAAIGYMSILNLSRVIKHTGLKIIIFIAIIALVSVSLLFYVGLI